MFLRLDRSFDSIPDNDCRLVEETKDLASNVLSTGLLVVHDSGRGGENNVTELTRRKELDNPLLHILELDVVARGDDTGLVQAAVKLDDNLAVAVVVDLLELANVACDRSLSVEMSRKFKSCTSWVIRERVRSSQSKKP